MKKANLQLYEAPKVRVLPLNMEGTLCTSTDPNIPVSDFEGFGEEDDWDR